MALPLLLAPIVYGSVSSSPSGFEACAVPAEQGFIDSKTCSTSYVKDGSATSCCWKEKNSEGKEVIKCQTCAKNDKTGDRDCSPAVEISHERPPPLPLPETETGPTTGQADPGESPPGGVFGGGGETGGQTLPYQPQGGGGIGGGETGGQSPPTDQPPSGGNEGGTGNDNQGQGGSGGGGIGSGETGGQSQSDPGGGGGGGFAGE